MNYFVTGAAGFIGSHVVDALLGCGHSVTGYDNLSTGTRSNLSNALKEPAFRFCVGDLLDKEQLARAMAGADFVFHLAANADVRFGTGHPRRDLEQNTIATWNVLDTMRGLGIGRIGFSSTGSVYGEPAVFPTPEDCPFPRQTSLYGASKLAAEGMIAAYCEGFEMQGYIFRFVSILGSRYSHGHVVDFHRQLRAHPEHLFVLGNGHQRKSYLHIDDCVRAILQAVTDAGDKINIFNLGSDETCEVNDSIRWICEHLDLKPRIEYAGGERGWVGDSPLILLDCSRMRALGWSPRFSIRSSIVQTVQYLEAQSSIACLTGTH